MNVFPIYRARMINITLANKRTCTETEWTVISREYNHTTATFFYHASVRRLFNVRIYDTIEIRHNSMYDIYNPIIMDIVQDHMRHLITAAEDVEHKIDYVQTYPIGFLKRALRARRIECRLSCRSHFDGICSRSDETYHLIRALATFKKNRINLRWYLMDCWHSMVHTACSNVTADE